MSVRSLLEEQDWMSVRIRELRVVSRAVEVSGPSTETPRSRNSKHRLFRSPVRNTSRGSTLSGGSRFTGKPSLLP